MMKYEIYTSNDIIQKGLICIFIELITSKNEKEVRYLGIYIS